MTPPRPDAPINTRSVRDRRQLSFCTLADLRREIDRIAEADRAGRLRCAGNWTAGQAFGHLATWINFALDGYPPDLRPPLLVKLLLRTQKKRFLRGPLPRGVRLPKVEGGTLGAEPLPLDEGLARLRNAIDRLERTAPTVPNPIFGPMTHDEWIQGHLRHAELHLGCLHPEA